MNGQAHGRETGTTFLEMVIVATVITVVVGGIFALYSTQLRGAEVTKSYMDVSRQNQKALQRMAEELLGTDSDLVNVDLGALAGTQTFVPLRPDRVSYTVNLHESITFRRVTGIDPALGTQLWSSPITFRLDAGTGEVQRVQDGNVEVLARSATRLRFFNALGRLGILLRTEEPRTGVAVTNRVEVTPRNAGEG